MDARIAAVRAKLGATTVILGHHYQRDEVVRFADFTGDSYKLSKVAAATGPVYRVLRCALYGGERRHFAQNGQQVTLPDLNAGCSMADMAEISQVEDCWDALERAGLADETIPVTYINSTAAIKAFAASTAAWCALHRARARRWSGRWARQADSVSAGPAFRPQHRARHGDSFGRDDSLGPWAVQIGSFWGGQTRDRLAASRMLLWKGHCAVHQRFLPSHADQVRAKYPGIEVIVHPECRYEVCQKADALGSTEQLIARVEQAPAGSMPPSVPRFIW